MLIFCILTILALSVSSDLSVSRLEEKVAVMQGEGTIFVISYNNGEVVRVCGQKV